MHLTGIQAAGFTASEFYRACIDRRIGIEDISFAQNGTTPLKFQVLPQLMKLQKCAKMTGEYLGGGTFLYTEKLVGNIVAGMGFVVDKNLKSSFYVPNTVLNKDIRDVTISPQKRVLAILKKKSDDVSYKKSVYLAKGIQIQDIIKQSPKDEAIHIDLQ